MAGGAACGVALLAVTVPRLTDQQAPKTAVMTAALFVGSLLAIPIPPTSVHLTLIGLAGVLLGAAAFPAVAIAPPAPFPLFLFSSADAFRTHCAPLGLDAAAADAILKAACSTAQTAHKDARATVKAAQEMVERAGVVGEEEKRPCTRP